MRIISKQIYVLINLNVNNILIINMLITVHLKMMKKLLIIFMAFITLIIVVILIKIHRLLVLLVINNHNYNLISILNPKEKIDFSNQIILALISILILIF